MLIPETEKRWVQELERCKRKIVEEKQNRLNDFNRQPRLILIFSHIFQRATKLKRLPKRKWLLRRRLKHRILHSLPARKVKRRRG